MENRSGDWREVDASIFASSVGLISCSSPNQSESSSAATDPPLVLLFEHVCSVEIEGTGGSRVGLSLIHI